MNDHVGFLRTDPERAEAFKKVQECANKPADIVFVLDESGSIWGPDFNKEISFIKDLVQCFDVSEGMTHIGVMTFDTYPKVRFQLKDTHGEANLLSSLDKITQGEGGTVTYDAIHMMRTEMFSDAHSRQGVPRIGIVITDGGSTDMDKTRGESLAAHQAGITMFAIGVGRHINEEELYNVASSPDNVYTVENYDTLVELKDVLVKATTEAVSASPVAPTVTCTVSPEETIPQDSTLQQNGDDQEDSECVSHYPVDVQFAISDQAGVEGTDLSLNYIDSIAERLTHVSDQAMVSVTPKTGHDSAPAIHPVSLTDNDNQTSFSRSFGRSMKGANTAGHLRYMYKEGIPLFDRSQETTEAARFGILIVDNKAADKAELLKQAQNARDNKIHVIVLGVGPYVEEEELKGVANTDDDWFQVKAYGDLHTLVGPVMERITNISQEIERKSHLSIDAQFSMPDQAGVEGTDRSLCYIDSIVKGLTLISDQALVSITPKILESFSTPTIRSISLKRNDNQVGFSQSIGRMTGANTAEHLRYMLNRGESAGSPEESVNFGILIVDNKAADKAELLKQAKNARDKKIHVIVLGVGPYVEEEELKGVANTDDDWFHVNSYTDLLTEVDPVMDRIEKVIQETRNQPDTCADQ